MRRVREATRPENLQDVADRLKPYTEPYAGLSSDAPRAREYDTDASASPLDDLMERVLTLVAVMPPGQRRATVAGLVSPYEPERGSRAVEALVRDGRLTEDDLGHLRLLRR
jgi:hypothetical protein